MSEQIKKAIMYNEIVEIIYMAGDGVITKRKVKPFKMTRSHFQAYCFLRKSTRTFSIDHVLACAKVTNIKRSVISFHPKILYS